MKVSIKLVTLLVFSMILGCGGVVGNLDDNEFLDGHHENPNEVMTTLKLVFNPTNGGDSFTVTWADPELDGDPSIDDITLSQNQSYTVTVHVLNELEEPTEDVTPEITDEMDEHQVFFTGSAVQGPCNTDNADALIDHVYDDLDVSLRFELNLDGLGNLASIISFTKLER